MPICTRENKELDCRVFNSADKLPDVWDDFLPSSHALRKEHLLVTEKSNLPDLSFLYVLVLQKGRPISSVYFQCLRARPEHINKDMVKRWQSKAWRLFTTAIHPKLLVAGHLFRHDTSFFYSAPDVSCYQAYQCFHASIDVALRSTCASAVLVKDMPATLVDHFQHHAPEYLLLRNDISMEMPIPPEWRTITDYEKSLKHKYAQRFRKIRQQWNSLQIKELSVGEVRENKTTIYSLYQQVLTNQQVRLGILSPEFLADLKAFYTDTLKIWAVYDGDKMIAFFSAWEKETAFDMFYIGFDYKHNAELQSYFNILFFSVEQAITLGREKLILGRTALDAKARLGCEPRYLHTFLFINTPLIRRFILRKQQNVTLREGDWEEKHPFKTDKKKFDDPS